MDSKPSEDNFLSTLVGWGEGQPLVRAMLLTSTQAASGAFGDALSDYDVILALSDVRPFAGSRAWLEAFGKVLVMYQDPLESHAGFLHSGNVVQFDGWLKIDFTLVETGYLRALAAQNVPLLEMENIPALHGPFKIPTELDAGYRVLLDKDNLTAGLPPPTYQAYLPHPPTAAQYLDMVEGGLLDAIYVAKYLRRGDLMAAQHVLVTYFKDEHLRPLLEWHYEIDHGWQVKPGPYGRRMQHYLRPDLWIDLVLTGPGPGIGDTWEALDRTLSLQRKVAREVGARLGFTFPEGTARRVVDYIQQIRELELGAA